MLTWLDVGNGWRNLYLLSCAAQMLALGTAFARGRLLGRRLPSFLLGMAATPFVQWLWMLLMGAVWPQAPRLLLIGALPAAGAIYLLVTLLRSRKRWRSWISSALERLRALPRMKPGDALCLALALALAIVLVPVGVRMATSTALCWQDSGEYLALASRYAQTRDLAQLLEKDVTDGYFVAHGHFPSLDLYESYAFLHTGGTIGYPYDKPVFTALGLLPGYLMLAMVAALLLVTRGHRKATALGLLLIGLVPMLYASLIAAPRDLWRMLAMLAFFLCFSALRPEGRWPAVLGKAALAMLLGFACMASHVVMFVILPFLVVAWVLVWWLGAIGSGEAGRTLGRAVVVALGAAAGVVTAFLGNLQCYLKWGQMLPAMRMDSFTDAAWYPLYDRMMRRSEAISTSTPIWRQPDRVLLGYLSPVGWLGLICALLLLTAAVVALVRRAREPIRRAAPIESLARVRCFLAFGLLLMLLPMTGLLDTPVYSFSGAFTAVPRYTVQWFLLATLLPPALLSALEERAPAWADAWATRRAARPGVLRACKAAPAAALTLLCVLAFAACTSARGYTDNVYRMTVCKGLLENPAYSQDNTLRTRYQTLLRVADCLEDGQELLLVDLGDQYGARGKGRFLQSDAYSELLVTPEAEMARALAEKRIAVIATSIRFWDDRFYVQTDLDAYLRTLPPNRVVEDGTMRFYVLEPSLTEPIAAWAAETRAFAESLATDER